MVALDKRADPAPVSSSYKGLADIADTAAPTLSEDQIVQSGGLLRHVDVPDEAPARAPQDKSEDPTATNGGPLGHVDVPDEVPARVPHDLTEEPTYTCRATHGKANHRLRSDGASRSWPTQWVARFAVIMAALGNWVSSTRVPHPNVPYIRS
ncbi:hypothetical protein IscW_ISCW010306 [Ixodes scapularis]|uniref:Uncharacterized protein n=1 Tax=Ixodes scapularis TaxID=6945 RepID=B7Q308_IXOSC|nr:hypothetical protein IscW_ISCW010306 [Ixodes scapularis]|eukprot:XP_002411106.1 hypothetical protein IscW_ISCW010306 [Ixodes scapularis]